MNRVNITKQEAHDALDRGWEGIGRITHKMALDADGHGVSVNSTRVASACAMGAIFRGLGYDGATDLAEPVWVVLGAIVNANFLAVDKTSAMIAVHKIIEEDWV